MILGDTWIVTAIGPQRLASLGLGLGQATYWQVVFGFDAIRLFQ